MRQGCAGVAACDAQLQAGGSCADAAAAPRAVQVENLASLHPPLQLCCER